MEKKTSEKHVWIIGAGFSQHAGGPLLNDLFSEHSRHFLSFAEKPVPKADSDRFVAVDTVYGLLKQKGFWNNPEDFLDKLSRLNSADPPPTAAIEIAKATRTIRGCEPISIEQLYHSAIVRLCKEVNDHLAKPNFDSDRLAPYKNWANHLADLAGRSIKQSIISFNYDLLVEGVFRNLGHELCVPMSQSDFLKTISSPVLYKLHGSVDWLKDASDKRTYDFHSLIPEIGDLPMIATPGDEKATFATKLKTHWDEARKRIEEADYIHLIGYRFSPNDSLAILHLLKSIRKSSKWKMMNIVLLQPENGFDVMRIRSMIGAKKRIRNLELTTQEFISFDRDFWIQGSLQGKLFIS